MQSNNASGQGLPQNAWGELAQLDFAIKSALSKLQTALPVKVIKCTNSGGVSPVGFVDIQPLVHQIDGAGKAIPHGIVTNVPYSRLQGGANAVIIDPEAGDIGIALFASRDISGVKATKAATVPGSFRKYDFSDAMYIGGILNSAPTQYIRFHSGGIEIISPSAVVVQAPQVTIDATAIQLGSGGVLRKLIDERCQTLYNGHTHPVTAVGSPTGTPNQQMTNSHMTSTTKAN